MLVGSRSEADKDIGQHRQHQNADEENGVQS